MLAIHLCATPLIFAQSTAASSQLAQTDQTGGFIEDWFRMTARTQAEQPHWLPPVATAPAPPSGGIPVRHSLATRQQRDYHRKLCSKGLELIPQRHVEILLVAPPP